MFKRGSRSTSMDSIKNDRPVAVTVVGGNDTGLRTNSERKIAPKVSYTNGKLKYV